MSTDNKPNPAFFVTTSRLTWSKGYMQLKGSGKDANSISPWNAISRN
jgi:hypothetical protein